MNPVWANEINIGTTVSDSTWTYAKLCKGIENMTLNANETAQQYFFLCGKGFAHNEVTGGAPEIQISGRRIVGDTAQDFIVGKQFALGADRNSSVKIIAEGKQIVCDCTITDVVAFGGATTDVNTFSCTLKLNGEPTVTSASNG